MLIKGGKEQLLISKMSFVFCRQNYIPIILHKSGLVTFAWHFYACIINVKGVKVLWKLIVEVLPLWPFNIGNELGVTEFYADKNLKKFKIIY